MESDGDSTTAANSPTAPTIPESICAARKGGRLLVESLDSFNPRDTRELCQKTEPTDEPSGSQNPLRQAEEDLIRRCNAGEPAYLVRIYDKVYDITEFSKRHPGGNVIRYFTQQDATEAFEAFHLRSEKARLQLRCLPSLSLSTYLKAVAPVNRCEAAVDTPPSVLPKAKEVPEISNFLPDHSTASNQVPHSCRERTPAKASCPCESVNVSPPAPKTPAAAAMALTDGDEDTHIDFMAAAKSSRTQALLRDFRTFRQELLDEGLFSPSIPHVVIRVVEVLCFFALHFYLLSAAVTTTSGGIHISNKGPAADFTSDSLTRLTPGASSSPGPFISLHQPFSVPSVTLTEAAQLHHVAAMDDESTRWSAVSVWEDAYYLEDAPSKQARPAAKGRLAIKEGRPGKQPRGTETRQTVNYFCLLLAVVVGGLAGGRAGWLQHEGGHRSLTGHGGVDKLIQKFGISFGLICYNKKWNNMHNKHHAVPQKEDCDPDLDTLPFLATYEQVLCRGRRRYMVKHMTWWLKYQHISFLLLTAVINVFFWHFILHPREYIMRKLDLTTALLVLSRYTVHLWIAAPLFGIWGGLFLLMATMFVSGLYLFGNFSLNHTYLPTLEKDIHKNWFDQQLDHTANVDSHPFVNWWMGYLNCQIEHHLFPNMPQFRQPKIVKRTEAFCKRHNIMYRSVPYFSAVAAMLGNLRAIAFRVDDYRPFYCKDPPSLLHDSTTEAASSRKEAKRE